MTNTNPQTGIRYGVIAMRSLDPDVAAWLFDVGDDITYKDACEEIRERLKREADDIEEEACQAVEDRLGVKAEKRYETLVEQEIEARYQSFGYDDREDFLERRFEEEVEDLYIEEPSIVGEVEGISYQIGWLGGAPLLWVLTGPVGRCAKLCSPCVPNAGDLDSGFTTDEVNEGYECYVVPQDWMPEEN